MKLVFHLNNIVSNAAIIEFLKRNESYRNGLDVPLLLCVMLHSIHARPDDGVTVTPKHVGDVLM